MLHGPGLHRKTAFSSFWLLLSLGVAALTGANPVLVKQTTGATRDRHVRVYRTGQLRQSDGVEEVIIPRPFDPVHDDAADLVVSPDAAPAHAAPTHHSHVTPAVIPDGTSSSPFARTVVSLVIPDETQLPAPGHSLPHRGRAPPLAAL
jgi:hypothetical protein